MQNKIGTLIANNFNKRSIVALPLQQVVYEGPPLQLGDAVLTANAVDLLDHIRLVSTPELHWKFVENGYPGDWHKTAATGISLSEIENQCFVVFAKKLDWERIAVTPVHDYQIFEISEGQEIAENYLDILRLDLCDLTNRGSIPGTPGMPNNRANFSMAIFYSNNSDHEAHLIAGQTDKQMLVSGLGLEVDPGYEPSLLGNGEVGNIIRYALSWYRLALNTSSATQRFISMMILLELLADPEKYTNSKKIAQAVSIHNALDQLSYSEIMQEFGHLSGKGKNEPGLRTHVVHNGKRLEDLIQGDLAIKKLFRKIESWMRKMLADMIPLSNCDWDHVETFRQKRFEKFKIK